MGTPRQDNHGSSAVKPVTKPYGRIVLTLKNCLLPEDKLSPTPSQNDGLDQETEADLRILGCELIQTAGILLKLPQVAMATGQVLFQRFYYSKSFVRHAMETTAMGCICLASKIEEAPRRIRDVINVFHHIKQVKSQKCLFAHQSSGQGLMVVSWHYRYRTLKCKTHTAIEGLAGSPSAEQRLCGSTAKAIFLPNSSLPEQPIILFYKFLMFICSCLFYFSVPVTYVQALTVARYVRDLAMYQTCLSAASLPTNVCDSRQTVTCDLTLRDVIDIY